MADMHWFRWHHGTVTDPKFPLVARHSGATLAEVLAVWAYVLEAASASTERGTFYRIDHEAIDGLFNFPDGRTEAILEAMQRRGLIQLHLGVVVAWEKRQPKREREDDTAAERKRRQREREAEERAAAGGRGGHDDVTPRHAKSRQVTQGHAESHLEERRGEEIREENTPPTPLPGGAVGGESAKPTKAGEVCKAIKLRGVAGVNPSNPELLALIAQGVEVETFEAAADTCAKSTPPKGMAYLLGIVKRQLGEAATIASGAGMPKKAWDTDRPSVEAKGVELGLGRWDEHNLSVNRETFAAYEARVRRAVEGEPA